MKKMMSINNEEVYIVRQAYTGDAPNTFKVKGIIVRQFEMIPFKMHVEMINYESRFESKFWCFCEKCINDTSFNMRSTITTPAKAKFIETGKITKKAIKEWYDNPTTYSFVIDGEFEHPFMPSVIFTNTRKDMKYENRPNPIFKEDKKEHWERNPKEILDRKELHIDVEGYMIFPYITGDNYQVIEIATYNGDNKSTSFSFPVKVIPSAKKAKATTQKM